MILFKRMYALVEFVRDTNNAEGNDELMVGFNLEANFHGYVAKDACIDFISEKYQLDRMSAVEIVDEAIARHYLIEIKWVSDYVKIDHQRGLLFVQKYGPFRYIMWNDILGANNAITSIVLGGLVAAIITSIMTYFLRA